MAEFLWNELGAGEWRAFSAGSKPAGYVHPLAIKVMAEQKHDLTSAESKHVDRFSEQPFDLVITVCGNAQQACPTFHNAKQSLHWPFPDPANATGTEEEKLVVFRDIRDQIRNRIASFLKTNDSLFLTTTVK